MSTKMTDDEKYEALSAWAESDASYNIHPDAKIYRGPEARAESIRVLMEATGAKTEDEIIPLALGGRPSLDSSEPAGSSKARHVRFGADLDSRALAQARREGRTFSELVRTAVTEYLEAHPA